MRLAASLAAFLALSGCFVPIVVTTPAAVVSRERAVSAPSDARFDAAFASFRRGQGLPVATPNAALTRAAQRHAEDMVAQGYFAHESKDGRSYIQRLAEQGYVSCYPVENLAWGQSNSEQALREWIGSAGHLRNLSVAGEAEYGLGQAGNIYVLVVSRLC